MLYDELNKQEVREMYFDGFKNQVIRMYFYLQEGLNLLNDFKYLVAGILAVYYTLELTGIKWMVIMFVVAIPLLVIAGYIWTHRARKTIEYFTLKFTTHFGQYGVKLQERQLEMLEKLLRKLENEERPNAAE